MKRPKVAPRTLAALVGAGLLVYLAGGYFVLVSPKRGAVGDLEQRITQTEAQVAKAREAAAAPAQPEGDRIESADVFRLAKAMPPSADMPGILLELADVAQSTGITFESISPQSAIPSGGYQIVPVNVVFSGDFYELSDFLFRLRTLVGVRGGALDARGRLFSVQSLDFAESQNRFPEIQATMVVNAYVYGAAAPAVSGAAPAAPPPAEGSGGATSTTGEPATPAPPSGGDVAAAPGGLG